MTTTIETFDFARRAAHVVDICGRLRDIDDGTGTLRTIVEQAVADGPEESAVSICQDVREIVTDAIAGAAAERARG